MCGELSHPRVEPLDIFEELLHLDLDHATFLADARIPHERLHDLDGHRQKRRRHDHDAGAVRLLHHVVEMLCQVRINQLRRHEHHGHVLRLARNEIFLRDILDVNQHVAAYSRRPAQPQFIALGVAKLRESLQRKFGIDHQTTLVAGQSDDTIRSSVVRKVG